MSKLTLYNNYMIAMINMPGDKKQDWPLGSYQPLFLYLLLHVYVCVVEIDVWESRYLWRPEERVLLPGAAGELPDEWLFTCSACS